MNLEFFQETPRARTSFCVRPLEKFVKGRSLYVGSDFFFLAALSTAVAFVELVQPYTDA